MSKKLFIYLFLVFGLALAVNAVGDPYVVYGTVEVSNVAAGGMSLRLTNLVTSEVITAQSKGDGAFGFYLDHMSSGYSQGQALKIDYCISDTRCKERIKTGISVIGTGGLNVGVLYAPGDSSGGSAPYLLYGTVTDAGVLITSGSLTIKNVNKDYTITIDLSNDGYQFNLADLGYDTGDTIDVTYGAFTQSFTISGGGTELNFNVNVAVTTVPPSNNGGGSSGSNNQGGGAQSVNGGADVLNSPVAVEIKGTEKSQFTLNIKGSKHTLTLYKVGTESAEVWIQSDLIKVVVNLGESKRVDIDGDGDFDFYVYLESIVNGEAIIKIMTPDMDLTEKEKDVVVDAEDAIVLPPEPVTEPVDEEVIIDVKDGLSEGVKTAIWFLVIVIIVGLVGYYWYKVKGSD